MIQFDAVGEGVGVAAFSMNWNHLISGRDRIVFVSINVSGFTRSHITGVTLGGIAMTQLWSTGSPSNNQDILLYALVNPPLGSQNIVVTSDMSMVMHAKSTSYKNVSRIGQPHDIDVMAKNVGAFPLTSAITITKPKCWIISCATENITGPSAGTTQRGIAVEGVLFMGDSNGVVQIGTRTASWENNGGAGVGIQLALLPAKESGGIINLL